MHGRGPGEEELHGVEACADAAAADDGDIDGAGDLVDHPQRHRLDGRAGEAGKGARNEGAARPGAYRHCLERVDEAERVGARIDDDAGDCDDVGDVGRELDDDRKGGVADHELGDGGRSVRLFVRASISNW